MPEARALKKRLASGFDVVQDARELRAALARVTKYTPAVVLEVIGAEEIIRKTDNSEPSPAIDPSVGVQEAKSTKRIAMMPHLFDPDCICEFLKTVFASRHGQEVEHEMERG